ncbi:MAG: DUF1080 domain-containing protein [Phycisphaerae bacterium]|nr:DUF1080 domain-containing protein [Phycisphaerae bacterium]NIP51167.1 DUF1080 domain-containing protein [Phycisphaerae bacterium]NIS50378.1 DUF1080 domain-containing protein [Phycisphaerae bacterium]NIU08108.1 DUF1080 domain-containing protein [Phycisphaerae bacterium]NIU55651.1 DUF1080 domain-containing protein [Phycisphaerae bacterium]
MTVKRYIVVLILFMCAAATHARTDSEGFIQLFNGKDLTGWITGPDNAWVVENGVITLKREMDGKEHNADYLWTKDKYDDFILDLEFKIPERANSGIFLRTSDLKDPVYTGIEVQVANSYGRKTWTKGGCAGAIYDCLAPTKNTIKKPGEWNRFIITCMDNKINVVLNGEEIIDMDLNKWDEPYKNPGGTKNKFHTALKDFARTGYIGLQDHGRAVWYRNIKIKRLNSTFTLVPDPHGRILKDPEGRTVFRYMTKKPAETKLSANSVCCLYPLNTPSGERVVDFAPSDHPHHRGVFLAWHSISAKKARKKADFWGWGAWAPTDGRRIKNSSIQLLQADSESALLEVCNDWLVGNRKMIDEITFIVVRQEDSAYVVDLNYHITAAMDVTLDKTAFGGLCAKARKDGIGSYYSPSGLVKLPNPHHLKPETDWPSADWYDYTMKLDSGKTVGITILDHPANPTTTWHNLAPIAMVNPCIVAPGPVEIQKGQTLQLRYRLVAHDGPTPVKLLTKLTKEWRQQTPKETFRPEPGFVRLDNGKDLTGWFGAGWSGEKTGDTTGWSVIDGAIHVDSEAAKNHLFHEKTYSRNAIIRLQYRAGRAADSGLCIHGNQFQVRDYPNTLPDTKRYAPFSNRTGEWNDLEIDITDDIAVIKLNGEVIEKAWKSGTDPSRGLGLQKELGEMDFRYIRLKEKK